MMLEDFSEELYTDLFCMQDLKQGEGIKLVNTLVEFIGDDDFTFELIDVLITNTLRGEYEGCEVDIDSIRKVLQQSMDKR